MPTKHYDVAASFPKATGFFLKTFAVVFLWSASASPGALCGPAQSAPAPYQALLQLATRASSAGEYLTAKGQLESAIALSPLRFEAWTQLGLLYDLIDDFKDAEVALRRSLKLDPEQAQTHYLLGRTLIANPREGIDWPAAMLQFREVLRLDEKNTDAMDRIGVGLLSLGKKEEAIAILQRAVALTPGKAELQFDLGLALEGDDDFTRAAECYRFALISRPDYSEAADALGKVLFTLGHNEEAERLVRVALRLNPDLQDAHQALGRMLRKAKMIEQAQHEFEEAAALDLRTKKAIDSSQLSNAALAKASKGEFGSAESDLRTAIHLRPDAGIPHYNLGLILADEHKLEEAALQLSLAISLMTARAQPWVALAKVERLRGSLVGARYCIEVALQLDPTDANAKRVRTEVNREPMEEIAGSELSLPFTSLTEDTVASHGDLADILQRRGDWQDAAGQWQRVLTLQPNAFPARLRLAHCLQQTGDTSDSILEERKALFVAPESASVHTELAQSLLAAGQIVEARAELQQALILDPESAPTKALLKSSGRP